MNTYTYEARATLDTGEPAAMSGTVKAACLRCALWEAIEATGITYAELVAGAWVEVRDPATGAVEHVGGKPKEAHV